MENQSKKKIDSEYFKITKELKCLFCGIFTFSRGSSAVVIVVITGWPVHDWYASEHQYNPSTSIRISTTDQNILPNLVCNQFIVVIKCSIFYSNLRDTKNLKLVLPDNVTSS